MWHMRTYVLCEMVYFIIIELIIMNYNYFARVFNCHFVTFVPKLTNDLRALEITLNDYNLSRERFKDLVSLLSFQLVSAGSYPHPPPPPPFLGRGTQQSVNLYPFICHFSEKR